MVIYGLTRRIITEAVNRVLTGMEATFTDFHFALMLVFLADFILKAPASHVTVKALIGRCLLFHILHFTFTLCPSAIHVSLSCGSGGVRKGFHVSCFV